MKKCACVVKTEEYDAMANSGDFLGALIGKIDLFEAQREGNPDPMLLEFTWNEVIKTYKQAKEAGND